VPEKPLLPVLDGLALSVFIVDSDRKITFVNKSGSKKFGKNLVGLDFVQIIRDPGCLKAIAKTIKGRKSSQVEVLLQAGIRITYRVNVSRLGPKSPPNDNGVARAVISLEDISHIREAQIMRSDFVANVSHELRSPLTAINGFIETLKGAAKNDEQAREKFLGIMEDESQRMVRLIEDLLSLSKVQASEHVAPQNKVDLKNILEHAIEILAPLAKQENTKINFQIPDNEQIEVVGDKDQLLQVFINLLENAIKYGATTNSEASNEASDNQVEIIISHETRAPGIAGPAIAVKFSDQGPGIPPEHIPRLTERFYRIDTGRSRQKGGTGLGLAIVKHIVARHRGRLQIRNNIEKGCSFTIFFPADF